MKITFKILALPLIFAMGCSSSSSKKDSDYETIAEDPSSSSANESKRANLDNEKPAVKPTMSSPAQNLSQAQHALSEAQKSQNEDAIYKAATAVLVANPQDVRAQNALGLYHFKRLRYLAAQYFFSKALQINPKSSEIHNNMGLVRLVLKEPREAIQSFRKAIELDPDNYAAASNLGALYVENRDFQKATVPLEMAVQKNPKDYRNRVNYGLALAGSGKSTQAKEQYDTAIKINSSGKEAIFNLAVLDIDQLKQYQEGLDLLNKVRFLGVPDSVRARIIALENKAKAGLK